MLFFSLAILIAIKGWWQVLIILTPIAEYNKESFLFFLIMLFPILTAKLGMKKAGFVSIVSIILSGCIYLYVKSLFYDNPGDTAVYQLPAHWEHMLNYHNWFEAEIIYGVRFGYGVFLPYLLLLAWLIKCTWKKLTMGFKYHIGIAAAINIPLYLLFCAPNELRNLSMLYIGFIAMLSIYIKNLITAKGEDDFGTEG